MINKTFDLCEKQICLFYIFYQKLPYRIETNNSKKCVYILSSQKIYLNEKMLELKKTKRTTYCLDYHNLSRTYNNET